MYSVKINETSLKMKEFEGQRVVTLKDIDLVHQRTSGTARKRFNDNKKHFILNTDCQNSKRKTHILNNT